MKAAKLQATLGAANSFDAVAKGFMAKIDQEGWAGVTLVKARWLHAHLSPDIGKRVVAEITSMDLLAVFKRVEKDGKRETARRLCSFASRVFRYAVATARAELDPTQPLIGALIAPTISIMSSSPTPRRLAHLCERSRAMTASPPRFTRSD